VCHREAVVFLASTDLAEAATLVEAIERQLPGIATTTGAGDWFLFYDPDGVTRPDQRFPFCTLVTADRYDAASDLDRDLCAYRINLGVDRESYEELFGPAPRQAVGTEVLDTGFDYTTADTVLPHPFYAPLHWLCVVNPGERSRSLLATLLEQAHELAKRRYDNQRKRQD